MTDPIVIVGAGPAGLRAAEQLVRAGQRPVLIDEATRVGGQIYRQPPAALQRSRQALYGFEAGKAGALHDTFAALRPQIDYRPDSLVWQIEGNTLHLASAAASGGGPLTRASTQRFSALILATGATDRVLPFPGWTLPGVFTLGGAQVVLKAQACLIGPQVVFAGSGPLLYLVAWQYAQLTARQGGQVLAVLDGAPPGAAWRALPRLLARPEVLARGAYYLARLRAAGVPVHHGVRLQRADGDGRLESLTWQAGGRTVTTACDALAFGHGLRPETQLADLAGCAFHFDPADQAWLPRSDGAGRSSVPGVYLAGDGAGILGADAAELSGALAAVTALGDLRRQPAPAQVLASASASASASAMSRQLAQQLQRHRRFRAGLELLSPPPADWATSAPDELIVCRCEEITAGDLRACVRDTGLQDINRLKALTRIGMGRCQGRMCAPAASRLLAIAAGCTLAEVGRLRGQAPVKPLPIRLLAEALRGTADLPVPADEADD